MTRRLAIAAILALGCASSAIGGTALEYLPGCRAFQADAAGFRAGYCAGLVMGIASTAINVVCLPKGVTGGQAVDVVVRYIDARPERQQEEFMSLALEAMKAAWPCR
jgi:hypothetical protein